MDSLNIQPWHIVVGSICTVLMTVSAIFGISRKIILHSKAQINKKLESKADKDGIEKEIKQLKIDIEKKADKEVFLEKFEEILSTAEHIKESVDRNQRGYKEDRAYEQQLRQKDNERIYAAIDNLTIMTSDGLKKTTEISDKLHSIDKRVVKLEFAPNNGKSK